MAKSKTKKRSLRSTFMLGFVLVISSLVMIEVGMNIANEVSNNNQSQLTQTVQPDLLSNAEPTATFIIATPGY